MKQQLDISIKSFLIKNKNQLNLNLLKNYLNNIGKLNDTFIFYFCFME